MSVLAANNADAPTLSVIYHNDGWEAVRRATRKQHETGAAAAQGVPEGDYGETVDLLRIATISDAHTRRVDDLDSLHNALETAVAAVDGGQDAVLDVRLDPKSDFLFENGNRRIRSYCWPSTIVTIGAQNID